MNVFPLIVAPMLPILWALVAGAVLWRNLSSPWLFLVTAVFALFGIQTVISTVWECWAVSSNFLEASAVSPEAMAQRLDESNRRTLVLAGLVLLSAFPFLWWLKNGFAPANKT